MTDHVVQIVAPEAVLYSLDRGFTLTEFEPGEFYSVPEYAAEGMIKRGWAKYAKDATEPPPQPESVETSTEDHKSRKRSK